MPGTAKKPFVGLFEQAGEAHTGTSEGSAHIGTPTATPWESAKDNCCVHFTHMRTHTHALVRAMSKGDRASFSAKTAFSGLSALEPTLGLLLVFFNNPPWNEGSGIREGGQQPFFSIR